MVSTYKILPLIIIVFIPLSACLIRSRDVRDMVYFVNNISLHNLLDHVFRLDLRTNYFLKMLEKDGFLHGKIQITIFNVN